jgi:hypothetical protein
MKNRSRPTMGSRPLLLVHRPTWRPARFSAILRHSLRVRDSSHRLRAMFARRQPLERIIWVGRHHRLLRLPTWPVIPPLMAMSLIRTCHCRRRDLLSAFRLRRWRHLLLHLRSKVMGRASDGLHQHRTGGRRLPLHLPDRPTTGKHVLIIFSGSSLRRMLSQSRSIQLVADPWSTLSTPRTLLCPCLAACSRTGLRTVTTRLRRRIRPRLVSKSRRWGPFPRSSCPRTAPRLPGILRHHPSRCQRSSGLACPAPKSLGSTVIILGMEPSFTCSLRA